MWKGKVPYLLIKHNVEGESAAEGDQVNAELSRIHRLESSQEFPYSQHNTNRDKPNIYIYMFIYSLYCHCISIQRNLEHCSYWGQHITQQQHMTQQ